MAFRADDPVPEAVVSGVNRLRQVPVNLISNAVKFTERGRIEVTAEARRLGGDLDGDLDGVLDGGPDTGRILLQTGLRAWKALGWVLGYWPCLRPTAARARPRGTPSGLNASPYRGDGPVVIAPATPLPASHIPQRLCNDHPAVWIVLSRQVSAF
jgi:hypothetical protein